MLAHLSFFIFADAMSLILFMFQSILFTYLIYII